MSDIETTPKRGRPAASTKPEVPNERKHVALAVLSGVLAGGHEVANKYELIRWCYEMADAFIEVGDEQQ